MTPNFWVGISWNSNLCMYLENHANLHWGQMKWFSHANFAFWRWTGNFFVWKNTIKFLSFLYWFCLYCQLYINLFLRKLVTYFVFFPLILNHQQNWVALPLYKVTISLPFLMAFYPFCQIHFLVCLFFEAEKCNVTINNWISSSSINITQ